MHQWDVKARLELQLIERASKWHHLLRDKDLRAARVSPAQWDDALDLGLWVPVIPGHYRHAATPLTFEMKVRAGAAWLGRRGALDGGSALAWLGVDASTPTNVIFLVPRARRSIPNWMTLRTTLRWSDDDITRHRGVRTVTAARAIVDFAASRPTATELERVIDAAVLARRTALPRLSNALSRLDGRGTRNTVLLRELLLDSGGESYLERRFLRLLRRNGLPRPDCQVVFRRDGSTVARVDFRFPGQDLVIEVSGRLGHVSDRDRAREIRRRNALTLAGQRVVEFSTLHVIDQPDYVLATLAAHGLVAARPRKRPVKAATSS